MKVCCLLICVVFITSCYKEESSYSEAYVKNSTTHQIRLVGFLNGVSPFGDTLDLNPGEKKLLGISTQRGKEPNGFHSDYFMPSDSLIVSFDNQYKVVHYVQTPVIQASKSHLFSSNRNFLNAANYERVWTEAKRATNNVFTFEFTEADYQFAL